MAIAVTALIFLALDDGTESLAGLGLHPRPANVGVDGWLLGVIGGGLDREQVEIGHQILIGRTLDCSGILGAVGRRVKRMYRLTTFGTEGSGGLQLDKVLVGGLISE